MTHIYE
jgi:glycerol uptake facilitator-like aquaporin